MRVLITGGAGYIGATIGSACQDAGHEVVVLDDLSAGRREFTEGREFFEGDVGDVVLLDKVLATGIDAVVHCAAKIIVPESVADPIGYYRTNVSKSIDLAETLVRHGVRRVVFSSSASIYASTDDFLVTETSPFGPQSPYARTKAMMEWVLEDVARTGALQVLPLRYFNPIGADPQLRTGQQVADPTHVLGRIMNADLNNEPFTITGCDWPTPDGSGLRDYIHVWDLARAHVAALENIDQVCADQPYVPINIGTGKPSTVRDLVQAYQEATGHDLDVREGPARPGDVAGVYASADHAADLLNWRAERTLTDGIRDALAWQEVRPQRLGY
ncbi:UDP-glucose 4-epimerase GalE [Ammonicoccus fulvus]|uniref:UDP-glucose 4-epimerase n=1 Tax=Ammonicoccus fulvus TaxID=3138240 RepID=A0ABZ3FNQ8_9ACTN